MTRGARSTTLVLTGLVGLIAMAACIGAWRIARGSAKPASASDPASGPARGERTQVEVDDVGGVTSTAEHGDDDAAKRAALEARIRELQARIDENDARIRELEAKRRR